MILRTGIFTIIALVLLAPAMAQPAEMLAQSTTIDIDPVAFCCETINTSNGSGQGCYAVASGSQGISQCSDNYLDCGRAQFECTPPTAKARDVLGGFGAEHGFQTCTCGNPAFLAPQS